MASEEAPEPEYRPYQMAELTAAQIKDIDSIDISDILDRPVELLEGGPYPNEEEALNWAAMRQKYKPFPLPDKHSTLEPHPEPVIDRISEVYLSRTSLTRYEKITGAIGAAAMAVAASAEALTHDKSKLGSFAVIVGAAALTLHYFSTRKREHGSR